MEITVNQWTAVTFNLLKMVGDGISIISPNLKKGCFQARRVVMFASIGKMVTPTV
jgi:hypothetical protein